MNKRIRKKKNKQQLIRAISGLVEAAEEMQREQERRTDDMRKCIVCGASFASKSNSVKYCPDCRKRITRRQAAERMRKKRTLVTQ